MKLVMTWYAEYERLAIPRNHHSFPPLPTFSDVFQRSDMVFFYKGGLVSAILTDF